MQQVVGLGVVTDADVLREEEGKRESKPLPTYLLQTLLKNRSHHGLVDEPSALELNHAKSICWVGPGVLDHAPFVPLRVNLHQLVGFLDGVGTGRDGRMLRRQLTAGASGWMARKSSEGPHVTVRRCRRQCERHKLFWVALGCRQTGGE